MKKAVCIIIWIIGLPFRLALCILALPLAIIVSFIDLRKWSCGGEQLDPDLARGLIDLYWHYLCLGKEIP